jgi:hypothetical protein
MNLSDAMGRASKLSYEEEQDQIIERIDGEWSISEIDDLERITEITGPLFRVNGAGVREL